MTSTAVPLELQIMVAIVVVVIVTHSYLSRQTPQTTGKWALVAVILGFISWSVLLLDHHNAGKTLGLWSLAGFAVCELIALRAGFQALSTNVGRWALAACTWPLMVLAVASLVHTVQR
jgi:hypothetical protein